MSNESIKLGTIHIYLGRIIWYILKQCSTFLTYVLPCFILIGLCWLFWLLWRWLTIDLVAYSIEMVGWVHYNGWVLQCCMMLQSCSDLHPHILQQPAHSTGGHAAAPGVMTCKGHCSDRAANQGSLSQSRRRLLLGPSPYWKRLLAPSCTFV